MSLTIELPSQAEARLKELASAAGQSLEAFTADWLTRSLTPPPTFAELAAPFARSFQQFHMTEAELDDLVEEVRDELHTEWQNRPGPQS